MLQRALEKFAKDLGVDPEIIEDHDNPVDYVCDGLNRLSNCPPRETIRWYFGRSNRERFLWDPPQPDEKEKAEEAIRSMQDNSHDRTHMLYLFTYIYDDAQA
jgi:hypothetical protein